MSSGEILTDRSTDKVTVPEFSEAEFEDKPPYFKKALEADPDFSYFMEAGGNEIHGSGSHLKSREGSQWEKTANLFNRQLTSLPVF